ncbi:MAG: hypothetical protein WCI29_11025, partial [Actinomycetes bacterium]
ALALALAPEAALVLLPVLDVPEGIDGTVDAEAGPTREERLPAITASDITPTARARRPVAVWRIAVWRIALWRVALWRMPGPIKSCRHRQLR